MSGPPGKETQTVTPRIVVASSIAAENDGSPHSQAPDQQDRAINSFPLLKLPPEIRAKVYDRVYRDSMFYMTKPTTWHQSALYPNPDFKMSPAEYFENIVPPTACNDRTVSKDSMMPRFQDRYRRDFCDHCKRNFNKSSTRSYCWSCKNGAGIALLLTSHQIHKESIGIFYAVLQPEFARLDQMMPFMYVMRSWSHDELIQHISVELPVFDDEDTALQADASLRVDPKLLLWGFPKLKNVTIDFGMGYGTSSAAFSSSGTGRMSSGPFVSRTIDAIRPRQLQMLVQSLLPDFAAHKQLQVRASGLRIPSVNKAVNRAFVTGDLGDIDFEDAVKKHKEHWSSLPGVD